MKIWIVASALLALVPSASAGTRQAECHGILHADRGDVLFGGRPGEGEGICVLGPAVRKKVLAVCSLNHFCRVTGAIDVCKDSGECTVIKSVSRVQKL